MLPATPPTLLILLAIKSVTDAERRFAVLLLELKGSLALVGLVLEMLQQREWMLTGANSLRVFSV